MKERDWTMEQRDELSDRMLEERIDTLMSERDELADRLWELERKCMNVDDGGSMGSIRTYLGASPPE